MKSYLVMCRIAGDLKRRGAGISRRPLRTISLRMLCPLPLVVLRSSVPDHPQTWNLALLLYSCHQSLALLLCGCHPSIILHRHLQHPQCPRYTFRHAMNGSIWITLSPQQNLRLLSLLLADLGCLRPLHLPTTRSRGAVRVSNMTTRSIVSLFASTLLGHEYSRPVITLRSSALTGA